MEFVKKYKIPVIVTGVAIILVLLRTFSLDHFGSDATMRAKPSVDHSVIISANHLRTLSGDILVLNLARNENLFKNLPGQILKIPADSVLGKRNLKKIFSHKGPLLVVSTDNAVSARIWMILSQMGRKDIFILTDDEENEVLKHKFRSDTLTRPESQDIK